MSSHNILPKIDLNSPDIASLLYADITMTEGDMLIPSSEAESDGADTNQTRPRKRQRLDHLTQEEKIMRRKMKNRVAAQTARDRKKAKMSELEKQNLDLININLQYKEMLLGQKELMKQQRLEIETLKKRLTEIQDCLREVTQGNNQDQINCKSPSKDIAETTEFIKSGSLEQASFINVSRLQKQDPQIALWVMQLIILPATARVMTFWILFYGLTLTFCKLTQITPYATVKAHESLHRPQKWWGPQQKSWNPTKN
ncbi:putative transcription factor XBP-1 [Caerostris extrusa]|uniref:X-box-binding protein 1 n=1 Tax=Caerostris extrusa TaxID=172846 RepID=A0AAV4RKX4_CAEEX|nr:putative transcription factor XBP-1 [Caerostris extrusa]